MDSTPNKDEILAAIDEAEKEKLKTWAVGEVADLSGDGGVTKTIITAGSGSKPPNGSKVKVHYVGTLPDGSEFDSSRKRDTPFEFTLGAQQVIKAWDLGVAEMILGEKAMLVAKSDYAYGDAGAPPSIPAKATLNFEVELLDWEEPEPVPQTNEEKIEFGLKYKVKGNEFYKNGDHMRASMWYNKAADMLGQLWQLDEPLETQKNEILLPVHLNMAQVLIKMGKWNEAYIHCSKALDIDEHNVKALYRRSIAQLKDGKLEEALSDALEAKETDPSNKEVARHLGVVQKAVGAYKAKEKKMYSKMFG